MDNLDPVRSFFKDLITPIVKDAVKEAMPVNDERASKHLVPVKEISKKYSMALSTLYNKFNTGQLTRYKDGWLTFVDEDEFISKMKTDKLAALETSKAGRKR